jgi:uncharacterized membrane protein
MVGSTDDDIDGEANHDISSESVALSDEGMIVAASARSNDGKSTHARIFEWNNKAWVQVGGAIDGEAGNDQPGSSVALSSDGSTVAIGAMYNDGNGTSSGHVRIFEWNNEAWNQLGDDID